MALINTISPSNTKSHSAESLTPMERKRLRGMNNIHQEIETPDRARKRNQRLVPLDFAEFYMKHGSIREEIGASKLSHKSTVIIPPKAFVKDALLLDTEFHGKMVTRPLKRNFPPAGDVYKHEDVFLSDYIIAPKDMREDEVNRIEKERALVNLIMGEDPVDHFTNEAESNAGGF